MLDKQLIDEFGMYINSSNWTYFKYKNNHNQNQWNCICSAMDWIDVAIEYINNHPLSALGAYQSIELYSYLTCVDIIVEAIEQLHRVIYSTPKRIFEDDSECFNGNQFNQNDRDYFKHLRACFGAHPVNLNDPEDENKKAKRFASWSGGNFGIDDFSVILYSNKIHGEDILLGLKFNQIDTFVEKYYNHLSELKMELNRQYEAFCETKRKQRIEYCDDTVTLLIILQNENKERLNYDYYRTTIEDLLLIYQTTITCNENILLVDQFRSALKVLVDEIYHNLQDMVFMDLENDKFLYPTKCSLPRGWEYWVEKVSQVKSGTGYPPFIWMDGLKRVFEGRFVFEYQDAIELYILIHAAMYRATL